MKVISLWQPWATLIAVGAKQYETRGWATSYRGQIAIHAAKKNSREVKGYFQLTPFQQVLGKAGYSSFDELPLGAIVAVADLTAIYDAAKLYPKIGELEQSFGNYGPGRYAWRLENVVKIEPIPVKGKQGLFEWDKEAALGDASAGGNDER